MEKQKKAFKNQRVRRMLVMVENDSSGSGRDMDQDTQSDTQSIFCNQTQVSQENNTSSDIAIMSKTTLPETLDLQYNNNNIPSPDCRHQLYLHYLNTEAKSPSTISNVSTFLGNIDFIASPNVIHKVSSNVSTPTRMMTCCPEGDKTFLDLDAQPRNIMTQNFESIVMSEIIEAENQNEQMSPISPSIIEIPKEKQLQCINQQEGTVITFASPNFIGIETINEYENNNQSEVNQQNSSTEYNIVEETSPNAPIAFISRKRARLENQWLDKKSKMLKNSGKTYTSARSKKIRPAKEIKNVCSCTLKCYEKINTEKRKEIFNDFWKLGDHEHQWQYILRYVTTNDVKTIKVIRKNNRTQTIKYYLPSNRESESVQVCKKFFINTLSISEKIVYTAIEKGYVIRNIKDQRGVHYNRPNKMDILTEESIIKHIKLFPVKESHYIRQQSRRLYLSEDLNISQMYRLYVDWFIKYKEENPDVKEASKRQYETIFNTRFNYSFHKPKKDLCATCALYEDADDDRKNILDVEYQLHRMRKDKLREIKAMEKREANPIDTVVATFDLEKVLNVPQSNVGIFHYKRKYPIYNFTVHNSLTGKGHCYVWHFQIAKRGAIEIGSCLLKFIESEINKGIRKFSFYSDSCAGQNKNRFIYALYVYLAQKYKIEISHKYFEVGHSQSEGNSMHSCIERAKHNKIIYTPEQMYAIILNAKKSGEKYEVNEMVQNEILDIKSLTSGKNWISDSSGNKITWTKIKEVSAKSSEPGVLMFKYDIDDEYYRLITQNKPKLRGKKTSKNMPDKIPSVEELLPVYRKPLTVSKALYDDLMSLCNSNAIPPAYQAFYKNLQFSEQTTTDEDLEVYHDED